MPSDEAYGEASALRYAHFESGPEGFALRAAPHILDFYDRLGLAGADVPVLDVGCGTGQLARVLLDRGIRLTGIDPSPHMLRHAEAANAEHVASSLGRFLLMDAADLRIESSFGMAVATFNTLNHLPNAEALRRCVRGVRDLLDAGGYFLFDIDTPLGLRRTAQTAGISESQDETTFRIRRFEGDRLRLYATGWFEIDGRRYRYRETIFKIVIDPAELRDMMLADGWASVTYMTSDYQNTVDRPETESRAYAVATRT